ncbi:hypothetical protein [Shewanella sp. UCD-KL12]|uniref:hypothetical protein n=1 Tax=Shewanella sp. UCD-KL12 TaxID=1917163 RepID=UPI0009703818|nr:hypothetical protein [Shewanella sp. UCD-KL12]
MNKFFKMSLVAAAVAVTGTATAGTFAPDDATTPTMNENAVVYSTEGAAQLASTDLQAGPVVSYTFGAAYIVGDELELTFGGAYDSKSVFPTTVMVDTAQFDKVSTTATTVVYRVVSGLANSGSTFTLAQEKSTTADLSDNTKNGLVFTRALLLDAPLTITAASTTNNGASNHDTDTTVANAEIFAASITQFGTAAVTKKFNAVIDDSTAGASKVFVSGTEDTFSFDYSDPKTMPTTALLGADDGINDLTAAADSVAPIATILSTLATVDVAKYTYASAAGGVITTADNAGDVTFTVTYPTGATVADDTITIAPKTGASAPTMVATTYNAAIAANGATVLAAGALNAGQWTVTGSETVNVPYMPYGEGLSQVIYAQNLSASDVEVSVIATDEAGTSYDLGVVATATASSVTKLATGIKNGLAAEGFTKGKVSLAVKFRGNADIASSTVQLHTGYNANASDRGFVTNSSNGAAF